MSMSSESSAANSWLSTPAGFIIAGVVPFIAAVVIAMLIFFFAPKTHKDPNSGLLVIDFTEEPVEKIPEALLSQLKAKENSGEFYILLSELRSSSYSPIKYIHDCKFETEFDVSQIVVPEAFESLKEQIIGLINNLAAEIKDKVLTLRTMLHLFKEACSTIVSDLYDENINQEECKNFIRNLVDNSKYRNLISAVILENWRDALLCIEFEIEKDLEETDINLDNATEDKQKEPKQLVQLVNHLVPDIKEQQKEIIGCIQQCKISINALKVEEAKAHL